MRQIPLAIGPDTTPGFDTFVPGANAEVLAHLSGLQPGSTKVYLWGAQGSGKTHLLRAWAAAWQAQGQQVGCFRAGDPLPWTLWPDWSAVIIDDCHLLDEPSQRAAFSVYTLAAEQGVAFAAAGRLPPVDLPLREDLRTRLGWGHVFELKPLGEAEARAAVRREADRRGLFLSDEVMAFMLRRFSRDLKDMMALLDVIDQYALAQARPVTVPLLRRMLADDAELAGTTS